MKKITGRMVEVKQITEGNDSLTALIRSRIRQAIEVILNEKLEQAKRCFHLISPHMRHIISFVTPSMMG